MADTAVAVTDLTANTPTGSIYAVGGNIDAGMVSVSTGNTAVIGAKGNTHGLVIVISGDGTHTGTATFEAGAEPPSESAGLSLPSALSVAAAENYIFPILGGQFVKSDDGAIEIAITGTGPVYVGAFRLPLTQ